MKERAIPETVLDELDKRIAKIAKSGHGKIYLTISLRDFCIYQFLVGDELSYVPGKRMSGSHGVNHDA